MAKPKRYKAIYTVPLDDPFAGGRKIEVEGYYVRHIWATPPPLDTEDGHEKFIKEHTKHYIVEDGFSDWCLPREMEFREIDIDTLEEIDEN